MNYDYVAIFDADFKPDPDFLVSHCHPCKYLPVPQFLTVSLSTSNTFCRTA